MTRYICVRDAVSADAPGIKFIKNGTAEGFSVTNNRAEAAVFESKATAEMASENSLFGAHAWAVVPIMWHGQWKEVSG